MKNSKVITTKPQNATAQTSAPPGRSRKLLLSALVTTGGASLLVGGVLLGQAPQPVPQVTSGASTPSVTSTIAGAEVPYAPSKYPGVMVRHVPAAPAKSGGQKGWLYLKPGAKPSGIKRRYGTRGGVTYEAGKTSAGGTIAHVSPDFYPYAVAHVKRDGKARPHIEIKY